MKTIHRLLLAALSVSAPSLAQDTHLSPSKSREPPPAVRSAGCQNPKFKDAELAAYQALLKAREDAARVLEESITEMEGKKKEELLRLNLRYVQKLNACGNDADCTTAAKSDYDNWSEKALIWYDEKLVIAQDQESESDEEAQKNYEDAVKKARDLYCRAYRATGGDGPVAYSGNVCSLEQPFTVTGTHPLLVYRFEFTPSADTGGASGTFSYNLNRGALNMSGGGSYAVEGLEAGKPRIVANTRSTARSGRIGSGGVGTAHIDLVPIDSDSCNGQ